MGAGTSGKSEEMEINWKISTGNVKERDHLGNLDIDGIILSRSMV
jgi:hypothetical protein